MGGSLSSYRRGPGAGRPGTGTTRYVGRQGDTGRHVETRGDRGRHRDTWRHGRARRVAVLIQAWARGRQARDRYHQVGGDTGRHRETRGDTGRQGETQGHVETRPGKASRCPHTGVGQGQAGQGQVPPGRWGDTERHRETRGDTGRQGETQGHVETRPGKAGRCPHTGVGQGQTGQGQVPPGTWRQGHTWRHTGRHVETRGDRGRHGETQGHGERRGDTWRHGRARRVAVLIQAWARGRQARDRYHQLVRERATLRLQAHVRGWLARRQRARALGSVLTLQCAVRRWRARRKLRELRAEARSVERYRRLHVGLEKKIMQMQRRLDEQ
ncbi:uncharacterized protein LOC142923751, partial [Petromyzon marinus]|uniref:uncharacterized protein LOC142923751 n=1 Tax=Petromyzon marinus TaxID=7757 RepID=UPI003F704632